MECSVDLGFGFDGLKGFLFTHRRAFEIESITVMDESIKDRIGERGVGEVEMPLIDGELAGDDRGFFIIAVVEDF